MYAQSHAVHWTQEYEKKAYTRGGSIKSLFDVHDVAQAYSPIIHVIAVGVYL